MYLSELLDKKIITRSGKILGDVQNIEAALVMGKNKQTIGEVLFLIYGKMGFFERFGWKRGQGEKVAWEDVLRIEEHAIFVKEET